MVVIVLATGRHDRFDVRRFVNIEPQWVHYSDRRVRCPKRQVSSRRRCPDLLSEQHSTCPRPD